MVLRRKLVALLALLAAAFATALPAQADAPEHAQRRVTVATYNLYLGGDIGRLTQATSLEDFIGRAAALWQNVTATNFPERAETIADLLAADHPDVVGLQEVADWETQSLSGQPVPSYDFLTILLDALAARGTPYRVLVTNTNFVSPTVPIPPLGLTVQFTDRDVVIARADLPTSELKASNPTAHTYAARIPVVLPFPTAPNTSTTTIEIVRGWSTVDIKLRGKTYRFANTHLEAFSDPIRAAQGIELAADLSESPHPVILVGDINSRPTDASGPYGALAAQGFLDAWLTAPGTGDGDTSGQSEDLRNQPSALDHRIDDVLYRSGNPGLDAVAAHVIGEEIADLTETGMWPSDHAGVVATLHLARP